ncbi:SH3 domain-containing protein [Jejuia pallidilutea]|uniref:TolA protein n=1 Tax=Jejuia pallidilutea TaxID=504487 RepID=A0A090VNC5_9FLAO|nr:SH3 domain-containing protein [Jejuia pallidilutea]GAL66221.1 TolA protein [Jejuia pallidilutea]GAL71186.1 TolA protein [Jejuia pallidilutea]GAL88246.1 TolA protein [Jejuia pallidilutea]
MKTKFIENGNIHQTVDTNSKVVAQFKSNQKCTVIEYSGQNIYKIQYEEAIGFVSDNFLEINDDMMDLFYEYEEREMRKLIAEEENRKKKIQDIVEQTEKRKRDSIAKLEKEIQLKALEIKRLEEMALKRKQDSIAKIQAAEAKALAKQQELEQQRLAALAVQRKKDSIAEIQAAEAKREIELKKALEQQKQEALEAKKKLDSIAKAKEAEKQKLAIELELARKQVEELKAKRIKDSIAKLEASKRLLESKQEEDISINKNTNTAKAQEVLQKQKAEVSASLKFRDSCHYQINEYDRFYNIRTIRTDAYNIAEHLTVELYKQGLKTNVFFNLSESLGCASYLPNQRSSVKITLENGQIVSFYHSWDIHCGEFLFKANLNKAKISSLETSPIQSILLRGTEGSKEITNITYNTFFMDKLKCVE